MAEANQIQLNPNEALRSAGELSDGDTPISLFARLPKELALRAFALNSAGDLATEFREAAARFAQSLLQKRALVAYSPGRKPDDYELAWLPTSDIVEILPVLETG